MHWANNTFEYIRPVHTLTVLLDEQAFDLDFLDIKSGRTSRGHRSWGKKQRLLQQIPMKTIYGLSLSLPVLLSGEMIVEQIRALEEEHGVSIEIDEDLLNEVLNLVEYPTAFLGNFDAKYLEVPEEVLVTSMKSTSVTLLCAMLKANFYHTLSLFAMEMQSI